jgi:hypothetical protein
MKHTTIWAATTVGVVSAITTATVSAMPSEAATQFTVNATMSTSAFVIPCPSCVLRSTPDGAHIGGTEYDGGTITDLRGKVLGHYVAEEIGMTPFNDGPGRVQLVGTISLAGGQLTFQGLEEPPLDGGVAAITGGTGRYAGATGQINYSDTSDTVTRLVIRIN